MSNLIKQRLSQKYWCPKCRIFVENMHKSIETHRVSKNHKIETGENIEYEKMKAKYTKYLKTKTKRDEAQETTNFFLSDINNILKKKNIITPHENLSRKKWGIFWDDNFQIPYFFNFETGDCVWEKPKDFDGREEDIEKVFKENDLRNHNQENNSYSSGEEVTLNNDEEKIFEEEKKKKIDKKYINEISESIKLKVEKINMHLNSNEKDNMNNNL